MDKDLCVTTVHDNAVALAAAARLGLGPAVPTCPGWSVADLVFHVGCVHHLWAYQIKTRRQEEPDYSPEVYDLDAVPGLAAWSERREKGESDARQAPEGLIEWYEAGAADLEQALREIDPEEPVWSWSDDYRGWHYHRMMAVETTLHRRDAQLAHGWANPIDPRLARLGIDHVFDIMLPARLRWGNPRPGSGEIYHFHQTDGDGEWVVRFEPAGPTVSREHAKGDVAVRGTAADLFLYLWGRKPAEELEVFGDTSLLVRFFELAPPA